MSRNGVVLWFWMGAEERQRERQWWLLSGHRTLHNRPMDLEKGEVTAHRTETKNDKGGTVAAAEGMWDRMVL